MTKISIWPLAAVIALPFGLWGCQAVQGVQTVSDAQTAVGAAATAVTTIASSSSSVLTKAQVAACAGEAVANTVTDMLTSTGHTTAAANSADVSAALGYGCTWTLPAL